MLNIKSSAFYHTYKIFKISGMRLVALISLILLLLLPFMNLAQEFHICLEKGNYTTNSTYSANLNTVLATLPTNIDSNGFSNASAGRTPDQANAIVLCRGDVELDACGRCAQLAISELTNSCPNRKQAIIWYERCMVRYSNETIRGTLATHPAYWASNATSPSSPEQFEQYMWILPESIQGQAVNGSPPRKFFAAGNITLNDSQTIYALARCTPDLYQEDCSRCFRDAAGQIPDCCDGKRGGRVFLPSCSLRFESYHFFNGSSQIELAPPPTPDPPSPNPVMEPPMISPKGNSNKTRLIIIAVSISSCLMLAVVVGTLLKMRGKQERAPQLEVNEAAHEISTIESLQYAFSTLRSATSDFSESNKLGQGGFGAVYKGTLPNGQKIAIKRLSKNSSQGSIEFKNEVLFLAQLEHRNLVKLLGFSIEGSKKLLVYEYVPNGTLDDFIFDWRNRSHLDWPIRYKIIGRIARGLLYLHENSRLNIIHRDIKPSNILLDNKMNPKIADFGLARLFNHDETEVNTRRIVGTYGYMPPEAVRQGRFSVKSDVFSFGVLVLEIITGQKNNDNRNEEYAEGILSYAWKNWCDGTPVDILDPFLKSSPGSLNDILRCIHIGLLCTQHKPADRPAMASVVLMLNDFSVTLAAPSKPAFCFGSSNRETGAQPGGHVSENDASITELHPR